jgi:histidinol dehydrogenase
MHCWSGSVDAELVVAEGDIAKLVSDLRTLIPAGSDVANTVAAIVADVRARGDAALAEYTSRFDLGGGPAPALEVPAQLIADAAGQLDPAVRLALELAIDNVGAVGEAAVNPDVTVSRNGATVKVKEAPVSSAAVYVPGGRAPYPSTVVMGVTTARAAGVGDVVVCSPPTDDEEINHVILAACWLTGVRAVYRMGGAQSIAALAYGTQTIQPVDVIVGPGNLYVQEAKRQVSARVGLDGFAGPSDLLVIADPNADPGPITLDLLAQAEHGPGTLVLAASTSRELLTALADGIGQSANTGAVCRLIELQNQSQAFELAQAFAPEHLQLIGTEAEALADVVTRAGSVFVGADAGTAFGDYIAGSNHILPTDGAARFASSLSARTFRRTFTEVRVTDPTTLAQAAAPLARAEGFERHAQSMEARIRDNRGR